MDVWFDHSVPKVKLNLGGTVVVGIRQSPVERRRTVLVDLATHRGGLKTCESNRLAWALLQDQPSGKTLTLHASAVFCTLT
jgi:hypothetical protein